MEEWRPIVGFEGCYEVSSLGKVRSLARWISHNSGRKLFRETRILDGWLSKLGYRLVDLHRDGRPKIRLVNRLVCEAFHGTAPSRTHEAAHNDGDPSNNRADNLRWATHAENMGDKRDHGTHTCGERHSRAKLTLPEARAIFHSRDRGKHIAERFGVAQSTVCDIKSGRSWSEALAEAPQ